MIIFIIALAFILRLISLGQSLWLDEAISLTAVQSHSLTGLITDYSKFDFHPPGYFVILWFWTKLFGYSEVAARIPSVIFGVITVYLVYLLGKKIHSPKLGLIAAIILAVNPLHLYYSQEARMYSFAAMAVVLNLLFFIKLVKEEKYASIGFILSLLLVLTSDYLTYFIIPAEVLVVVLNKKKVVLFNFLKLLALTLVSWSWWLLFFISQLASGLKGISQIPGWKEVVGSASLKALTLTYVKFLIGRISLPDTKAYILAFLPIGLFFAFLIFQAIKLKSELRNWLLILILVPIFLSFSLSFFIPIFSYFRLLFLVPTFLLLIGLGILSTSKSFMKAFLTIAVFIELFCSLVYLTLPNFQREDWQAVVAFLQKQPQNQVILLESNQNFAPFYYYSTDKLSAKDALQPIPALQKFPASDESDLIDLAKKLEKENQVFLLQYLVDVSDQKKIVEQTLEKLGFSLKTIYNFNGVGFVYLYHR